MAIVEPSNLDVTLEVNLFGSTTVTKDIKIRAVSVSPHGKNRLENPESNHTDIGSLRFSSHKITK